MSDFGDDKREKIIEKQEKYRVLVESPKYQQEIKFFRKLIDDFIFTIRICSIYSSRYLDLYNNSLLIRNTDELLESAFSCYLLIVEGALNPARRELRYMVESSIKYLCVDQNGSSLNYEDKINYFYNHIPKSSISCIDDVKIIGLNSSNNKEWIDNANDVYKKLCIYVHPSKQQIDEFINRNNRGAYIGFETEVDIKKFNNIIYKVLEIVITCYFSSLGFSLTGDLFINLLDENKGWKFHKSKYIKLISEAYDYKVERKK